MKYYKSIDDADFEKSTCRKKEFTKYAYLPVDKRSNTQLLTHQQWLSNFISPKTPYKGMLVYHETGTGKTCTAVSIAENFRQEMIEQKKTITILSSEKISHEFYQTIGDASRTKHCTGNTYHDMMPESDVVLKQSDYNNKIKEFYSLKTTAKWGGAIMSAVENLNEEEKNKYIKEHYSNSVIIVDEAQHLRAKNDTTGHFTDKKVHLAVELLCQYADNIKMIFLTATPMYDNPMEIIWLINMLILVNNDNIELLTDDIFDKDYSFKNKESKEKFIRAIKGKVSFLRGGNPDNFPLKFEDPDAVSPSDFPDISFGDEPVEQYNSDVDVTTKITLSEISKEHYSIIKKFEEEQVSQVGDSFHTQMLQLHNVSWYHKPTRQLKPNKKKKKGGADIFDEDEGGAGLFKYFDIQTTNNSVYYTPKQGEEDVLASLSKYAPKAATIVSNILEMGKNGIAFVFSQYVAAGVIPVILALEKNGFRKYDGRNPPINHLKMKDKPKDYQGSYMVITSSKHHTNQSKLNEYINTARSEANKTGDVIRVIIASGAGGEGIDLKYIRQMHIMEPHFHFSMIEQAVGRAIRNKSHTALPLVDQNCTVFYHGTKYPKNEKETVDMHIYRMAIHKKNATNNVRKIIQEHSITCEFFKEANIFNYDKYLNKTIRDSKGREFKFTENMIDDEGYTNKCSSCQNIEGEDNETYNPMIHSKWEVFDCISKIQNLFKIADFYQLTDIIHKCRLSNKNVDDETIYMALDLILNSQKTFNNQFNISGSVIYANGLFMFKPNHYEYSGVLSGIPLSLANTSVSLSQIEWPNRPDPSMIIDSGEIEQGQGQVEKTFQELKEVSLFKDSLWSNIPETNQILAEIIIDRLTSQNRIQLKEKSILQDEHLRTALKRYEMKKGFLDIDRIVEPVSVSIVDLSKNDKPVINSLIPNKASKVETREVMAYTDIVKRYSSFMIRDARKTKSPQGKNLKTQNKKEIIECINYLVQEGTIMNKLRYVGKKGMKEFPPIDEDQYYYETRKGDEKGFDSAHMLIELEMFFRLLELRRKQNEPRWFLQSWETFEIGKSYGVKTKDKPEEEGEEQNVKPRKNAKTVLKK